jgi:hypothetical protein
MRGDKSEGLAEGGKASRSGAFVDEAVADLGRAARVEADQRRGHHHLQSCAVALEDRRSGFDHLDEGLGSSLHHAAIVHECGGVVLAEWPRRT